MPAILQVVELAEALETSSEGVAEVAKTGVLWASESITDDDTWPSGVASGGDISGPGEQE